MKVILLLFILPIFAQNSLLYKIEDLEILEKEKNYQEFFVHAKDLPPRQRDSHWKTMVKNMGVSYLQDMLKKKVIEQDEFKKSELLFSWSTLESDEFFKRYRGEIGLNYLSNCFAKKKTEQCLSDAQDFWAKDMSNPDIGQKLAMMILKKVKKKRPHLDGKISSKESIYFSFFLKKPLLSPFSEFYCQKEPIQQLIINELKIISKKQSAKIAQWIDENIHKDCWKQLTSILKKKLLNTDSSFAFQTLQSKDALSDLEKDTYYFTQILYRPPTPGALLNQAWNQLKKLGKDVKRREKVLKNIKSLDPIPDRLFCESNEKKKKVFLEYINQNFPEFLDFYARTCIEFLKGEKNFPKGNPTPKCHEFFSSVKSLKLIPDSIVNKYEKLKL